MIIPTSMKMDRIEESSTLNPVNNSNSSLEVGEKLDLGVNVLEETSIADYNKNDELLTSVNPFLQLPVIRSLAKNLSLHDLNSCRLLSKFWKTEMDLEEKNRKTLDIITSDDIDCELLIDRSLKQSFYGRYKKCKLENSNRCQLNFDRDPRLLRILLNLQPTLSHLSLAAAASVSMFNQIMKSIGHNLISLRLNLLAEMKGGGSKGVVFHKYFPIYEEDGSWRHLVFPNMRSLLINLIQCMGSEEEIRDGLSDFTRSFPNLTEFATCLTSRGRPDLLKRFPLRNLKCLKIGTAGVKCIDLNDLACLNNLCTTLTKLEFNCMTNEGIEVSLLKKLLESYRHTLEHLLLLCETCQRDILRGIGRPHFKMADCYPRKIVGEPLFPMLEFPNMKFLKIDRTYTKNLVHVLQTFPKLEVLQFGCPTELKWAQICPKFIPKHEWITALLFDWVCINDLRVIACPKHFPNFSQLRINMANDEMIRKIFKFFPDLKFLSVADNVKENFYITDQGITGIRNIKDLELKISPEGDKPTLKHRFPYIGNCRELTSLMLRVTSDKTGEKSILYGILDAPKLNELTIEGIKLSNEMLKYMEQRGFKCKTSDLTIPGYEFETKEASNSTIEKVTITIS